MNKDYNDPYGFKLKDGDDGRDTTVQLNNRDNNKDKGKKKKGGKRFLKVLAVFLAVIIAFVGVTTVITVVDVKAETKRTSTFSSVATRTLKMDNPSSGYWNIYSDDGIKVLQLTDIHIGGGWMSMNKDNMALNAVAAMISAEKPDLVIVTGDISYPVPFQAGTFNNKSGAKIFASLMEKLGVYWTLCFGNHDTEAYSYYTREDLTEFYSSDKYPHCMLQAGPDDVDGFGNQVINIVNSSGIITRSLILLDSHSYVDGDIFGIQAQYDNIHANQIAWYEKTISDIRQKNTAAYLEFGYNSLTMPSVDVKTSVFLHIPLTEYHDAWTEYTDNGSKDTADVKYNYGVSGETVCCGVNDDEMFETMLKVGSTDTVFCGHDHVNNYSVNYKGINLTYGMSIDYLAYSGISKVGLQRGCTIIECYPDGTINHHNENYYQSKYFSLYTKESVEDIKQ